MEIRDRPTVVVPDDTWKKLVYGGWAGQRDAAFDPRGVPLGLWVILHTPNLLAEVLPCLSPEVLSASDHQHQCVLHEACVQHPDWVPLLVQRGADANTRGSLGFSALRLAMQHHGTHPGNIACLLEAGADVNARDNTGQTPLMHACHCHPDLAPVLLERGALVNTQSKNGWTALMAAACHNPDLLPLLLSSGADMTLVSERKSALQWACARCPASVPALLAAGAQAALGARVEEDPLVLIATEHPHKMEMALSAGLDPTIFIKWETVLEVPFQARSTWSAWCLKHALQQSLSEVAVPPCRPRL